MNTITILEILGAFIAGGGVQALMTWRINKRKARVGEVELLVETWERDNKRLREIVERSRVRIAELEGDLMILRNKIVLLESAHMDSPLPMWLKDIRGVVLAINEAYERLFLQPIGKSTGDYVGHTDYDVWPKHIADQYTANDRLVLMKNEIQDLMEDVDLNGVLEKVRVIKYPRRMGTVVIGIAGISIPQSIVTNFSNP